MRDPRLYDMVSALASQQGVKATDLFKEMLEERIADRIRDLTHETRVNEDVEPAIAPDRDATEGEDERMQDLEKLNYLLSSGRIDRETYEMLKQEHVTDRLTGKPS